MNTSAETELRQLIDTWMQAVRERDMDGITAPYADDIVAFDAIKALQFKGKAAYRAHWEMCMGMCTGPMIFEMEQLTVHADGDLGLAHWLNRCGPADDDSQCGFMRASVGYRRSAGQWQVIHEHWSAPFDMETQKALFDLKP
ncbi:ketosteroid isomerase-like protein [Pseudomonas hunanensis]|uniref:Ketosteroid isomerase-like protein n=1 Tax=Pseudomonas hunanensis TaxID=1247546 RepID=A0ACC6K401_9PSED|nr:nuclear transport factor 2 family protein [Pseudomonas hunanensis]MDR6713117.1 ketosteroid isomerase-like protein [Pseudomonas hunanensis]